MLKVSLIHEKVTEGGMELLEDATADGILWIESDGSDDVRDRALLKRLFDPPAQLCAEFLHPRKPPKFIAEGDLRFLLLRGLTAGTSDLDFATLQLRFLWRGNLVFCRRSARSVSVEMTWANLQSGWRPRSGAELVMAVAKNAVGRFLPILVSLEDRLEDLEDALAHEGGDSWLRELVGYRTALRVLRRINAYHAAALAQCGASLKENFKKGSRVSDLVTEQGEMLERLGTLEQMYYDVCGDLIDGHLSFSAHRLNEIMKVLTIITAIFVPLGLIAGIYGMNFDYIPELHWRWGYFGVIGIMLTVAVGLLVVFRRRHWI